MSKKYLSLLPIFLITLLCAVVVRADWQDPTGAPPGNNQPRPLNVGAIAQEKTGPLILSHASNALILRDQSPLLFGNPVGNTVGFRAPSGLSASTLWTLPIADGQSGTVLTTNGAGQLSWTTPNTVSSSTVVDPDWRYEGTPENFTSIYSEKLTRVGSGGTRNYATGNGDLYVQDVLEVGGLGVYTDAISSNNYSALRVLNNLSITGSYINFYPKDSGAIFGLVVDGLRNNILLGRTDYGTNLDFGSENLIFGKSLTQFMVDGSDNLIFGNNALAFVQFGNKNIIIGNDAGEVKRGNYGEHSKNVMIGDSAGSGFGLGSSITAGNEKNVYIGANSGMQTYGDNNVFVGYAAGSGSYYTDNNNNNIFIGYEAGMTDTKDKHMQYKLYIEPSSASKDNVLIYGQFYDPANSGDSPLLRVNGKLGLAPRGTTGFDMPNSLLHLFAPGGDNAEIDIQSVVGPGQHWGIYQDRADLALKFWHLGVNRLVLNDQGLSVTGNLTANGQRGFTGYTCLPDVNGFGVRHRYEAGLLICTCVDTQVCPGTCTCSNP